MKLVVEVLDSSNLMPKDGHGSASPFVEVDFENQRQRTQTKQKDLNPSWNEHLEFQVGDPNALPDRTIDVTVYNDRKASSSERHHNNFLGRVRISGASVVPESEARLNRFPLDKRGLFSHIRGDIALKIYHTFDFPTQKPPNAEIPMGSVPMQEETVKKKSKKEKEGSRVFQKPAASDPPGFGFGLGFFGFKPMEEKKAEAPLPQAKLMQLAMPGGGGPSFEVRETAPKIEALLKRGKSTSAYDLVEQMQYLYVHVAKARDLPAMDVSGSCDPYVEVKLGNYKGQTKHFEKNLNPVWNQVFAFSKERFQASVVEVVLKDKDVVKDDFVGRVLFEVGEVPTRVPPDSPMAPQWYKLQEKSGERKTKGEIMLAVWMGTQADEAFPNAWHSDAAVLATHEGLMNTRSRVYVAPKLWYLRVSVLEAQDLVASEKGRVPEATVRVQLGNQEQRTRPVGRTINPAFQEDMLFIAAQPYEDRLMIMVEDRIGPGKAELIGKIAIPLTGTPSRIDVVSTPSRWFSLEKPTSVTETEAEKKKEVKFASRIHLRLCLEGGYHVLDESTHYSSDLRATQHRLLAKYPAIGVLEIGIISANGLVPMKNRGGHQTTDAYCVAKYGPKWVRTRTIVDSLQPRWNEQYTWEVYDPCTVVTIGVFDNGHLDGGSDNRDRSIGKVRIRLSTLDTERVYARAYPLIALQPSGVKPMGELHLAVRFTCTSFVNMMHLYSQPLLPKMHYLLPLTVGQLENLRFQAMQIVASRLDRMEPPLRKEVVEYMLDSRSHMWSLRRAKANFQRVVSVLSGIAGISRWFEDVCNWRNPVTTILFHVVFLILVWHPELILPTLFLYMFLVGIWNYRFRPRHPPHMDVRLSHADRSHPDELDEEMDTFPTSKATDIVRMRYDRLRSVAGRVQTVAGDLATQGERANALLSWRDPRATAIFVMFCLFTVVFVYATPFQVVAVLVGLYLLRHPRFRTKLPSAPLNFYRRLPAQSDRLI
ncbi:FT-interacting protein 1-like [Amborella trichopoda]|uniref:FT-interacting protein 1-like n=1 Tax=Amborella trichopoda TaxID=13333 RepID=UPI0005D36EB0|nr:FT-interacting protein 1-like [Amborella trichopoda]|eukprot:XP_011628870.1 FT-interacting protein 1-like [Amborella trichopoda]